MADAIARVARGHGNDGILVVGAGHTAKFGSTAERVVKLASSDVLIYQAKGEYFQAQRPCAGADTTA